MLNIPKKVPEVGFYHHYKHDSSKDVRDYAYEFCSVGFHTEDDRRSHEEWFALYRPLYGSASVYKAGRTMNVSAMDCRPLLMWMEDVIVNGETVPRFNKITDPAVIAELEDMKKEMYL